MTDSSPSSFASRRSNRWVWIVPSVLLHIVVLVVWFLLPESEPREREERKLKIKPEQAEQLQEHVEQANLEELQAKIKDLQAIKASMASIRDQEMVRVEKFEEEMVEEAPQDIASLLEELAAIYKSVHETYEGIEKNLDQFETPMSAARKAAGKDTIAGIRALPKLTPLWDSFEGLADEFEVAFYETGATLRAIEVKLEWVRDDRIAARIDALKPPMEETFELHKQAWSSIPFNWKRERSFRALTEDTGATIGKVTDFRKSETEGKAEIAKKRKELEAQIAKTETELARANEALKNDQAALESIDRNEDRKAWNTKRQQVRQHERARRDLGGELQNLKKTLKRTTYKPDGNLARDVKRIEQRLDHALPTLPDRSVFRQAMEQQQEMVGQIEDLAKSLEAAQ